MKQVQQNYRSGELKVIDAPAPMARDGTILVATRASLISSGTEKQLIDLARASLPAKAIKRPDLVRRVFRGIEREGVRPTLNKVLAKLDMPIPLGYSLAGEAIEIGSRVFGFSPGDRVACAGAGLASHAEFNAVPQNLSVKIPAGVDDEAASFVTLGAIAMQGIRLAMPTLGERFVVMGLGLIGLLAVQLLKANGCRVLGFDPNADRAKLAQELGADLAVSEGFREAVSDFTAGDGADAVIVTASSKSSAPVNDAAEVSRLKGRIVVVGMVGMTIDREPFYKRELELKMSLSYGPGRHDPNYEEDGQDYPLAYVRWTERRNMQAFLQLVAEGKVNTKRLITHRFPITAAEQAYAVFEQGEPYLAILLTYPETRSATPDHQIRLSPPSTPSQAEGIAFIGLGNYARTALVPALRNAGGVTLTAAITATGLSAAQAGRRYGFKTVATDPAVALSDERTGTIFVATRHDIHAELAATALRAGKNVFCEKPLATDALGLADVVAAAHESGGILTVGFNRRFAPLLKKAKAVLAAKPGPFVMLYRINAGPVASESWLHRAEGGGRIVGEVCHFVDSLTYLCSGVPIEVHAISARDHYDAVSILLRFDNGSTGTIVYSSLGDSSVAKEYIEVFSHGCVIQLDDFRRLSVTKGGKQSTSKAAQDKGQNALVASFLSSIRGECEPPIPLVELIAVTQSTFAIEESLRTGNSIFIGHDGTAPADGAAQCANTALCQPEKV